jgi:hypothetical protein
MVNHQNTRISKRELIACGPSLLYNLFVACPRSEFVVWIEMVGVLPVPNFFVGILLMGDPFDFRWREIQAFLLAVDDRQKADGRSDY